MNKGYVNAVHVFGTSMLGRLGSTCHLQWQWRRTSGPDNNISLTKKQYDDIKKLLGPVKERHIDSRSIRIYHEHTNKHYMRVKRYLKRNKIGGY